MPRADPDPIDHLPSPAHVEAIARRLVAWPSETGTSGEAAFGPLMADLLREMPYFREHPDDLVLVPSHGDPLRYNVVAVVRGTGRRAVALAGHYDTVETRNYGALQAVALDPDALRAGMTAPPDDGRATSEREARLADDLRGGAFLAGRGMLDMKSGLAVGIALLERFAACADRTGNLILMATPDEERESRGARSLRDAMPGLTRRMDLDVVAAINLDVTSDQGDGALGRGIFAGTIGKLLPFALVVGQPSHAGYPFEGTSAQAIGAAILSAIEANPDLSDAGDGFTAPPPICLEARDLREGYDVTTPARFWLSFNWLFHAMSAADLFARFEAEVRAASSRTAATLAAREARYLGQADGPVRTVPVARVLTVERLRGEAEERAGPGIGSAIDAMQHELTDLDNPLELSRRIVVALCDAAEIAGPAIVIGFAGLSYPPTAIDRTAGRGAELAHALDAARAAIDAVPGDRPDWQPVFQGISDMSFMGRPADAAADAVVARNTPAARLIDAPPSDALTYPVVNVGPWGREFHQRGERVHVAYAFDALPRFLSLTLDRLLR